MQIEAKILKKWKVLNSHGDATKICEQMNEKDRVQPVSIRRALRNGSCSDKVFHALATFYKQKEESFKQALSN